MKVKLNACLQTNIKRIESSGWGSFKKNTLQTGNVFLKAVFGRTYILGESREAWSKYAEVKVNEKNPKSLH